MISRKLDNECNKKTPYKLVKNGDFVCPFLREESCLGLEKLRDDVAWYQHMILKDLDAIEKKVSKLAGRVTRVEGKGVELNSDGVPAEEVY